MITINSKAKSHYIQHLLAHLRMPLYRNGYALILGAATTAGLGMVYWALAARYYPAEIVGLSTAVISAMMLLAGVAMFSLTGVLVRFIPVAGQTTRRLILYTYAISIGSSALFGLLFCQVAGLWSPQLQFLATDGRWTVAFTVATVGWALFSLQDSALIGLRQALWIPLENTIFSAAKVILLVLLATLLPTWGLFSAWVVPVLVTLIPINWLIFRSLLPRHQQNYANQPSTLSAPPILRYIIGNYPGTLFYLASTTLLPLVVTQQAGVKATAYFFMPWMITTALLQIAVNMTTSLTVEAASDPTRLGIYVYRTLVQMLRLLIPLVFVFVIGAPTILHFFGPDYAREGAMVFRLLVLSTVPNVFIMLYISVARVQNLVRAIIVVQAAQCFLLLGLSYLLLPIYGIRGVGIALLFTQSVVALGTLLTQLRPLVQQGRLMDARR